MNALERTIPSHKKGIKKNYTSSRKFKEVSDAQLCYDNAIARLLNINHWDTISPLAKGMTQIMSGQMKMQRRKARLGDYVRIGLPIENPDGGSYDWVQVDVLKFSSGKRKEQCLMVLRPCPMPGGDITAHFFTEDASSNFLLTRDRNTVTADYYGHNETPNMDVSGLKEKIRNGIVAMGAMLGLSDTLWKPLTEGLLMDGILLRERKKEQV